MANNFDIIAEDAITLGLSDLANEVNQMLIPSRDEVKEKALIFLRDYEIAEQKYQIALKNAGKVKSSSLKQWAQLEYARDSFDDFQKAINAYYGQLIKIMYVYIHPETGQVILSAEENSTELLEINKNYKSVQYHLNEIKKLFKLEDYDSTVLDATQQSIYTRWNRAKQVVKKSQHLPILWKLNGVWEGARVNNLGTIAEAYVNFYMARYTFSNFLEQDVKTYILNNQLGAAAVDNASGFLIGDTQALDGRIQFAVKKDLASPIRLKKIYNETKKVINSPDFIESLGERFIEIERKKAKKNQVKSLSENIKDTFDELINDLEQHL